MAKARNKQELARLNQDLARIECANGILPSDRWTADSADYKEGLRILKDQEVAR